jgi:hypothetical protein
VSGCISQDLWIGSESPALHDTQSDGRYDSSANSEHDSGPDSGNVDPDPSPCAHPIPGDLELVHSVGEDDYFDFSMDSPEWTLGLIHAQVKLQELSDEQGGPLLRPSWFLALSLSSSAMDCDQPGGCYGLSETNHWALLCELYGDLDCSTASMEASVGSGKSGSGTLAMAWHAALSYALLPQGGFTDPQDWLSEAVDPLALEKILALSTLDSAWSPELQAVASGCQDRLIEDCISDERSWIRDQIFAIGAHIEELEAAVEANHCVEMTLTRQDVEDYSAELEGLFTRLDWTQARLDAAELVSEEETDLLPQAAGIIEMLDARTGLLLQCPEESLDLLYDTECPG